MRAIGHLIAGAIAGMTIFSNTAVRAQPQSWVSSTGSGTACTRAAPCADVSAAITATDVGGVVSFVDNVQTTAFPINKSITLRAIGVDAGPTFTLGSVGGPNISINSTATDTVVFDGLSSIGGGIAIAGAGKVIIRNTRIGFNPLSGGPGNAFGIWAAPNGPLHLVISDSSVENTGGSGGGAGIQIIPTSGGSARVTLERVSVNGNQFGVAVDGSNSTGGINMTIADSVMASNVNDGVVATTSAGGAPIGVTVVDTKLTNNGFGARSIGNNVTVRIKNSEIIGNGTGVSALSSGALLSANDNIVEANGTNGAFSGSIAFK